MNKANYLYISVNDIYDVTILTLLKEIDSVTGVSILPFQKNKKSILIQYLKQCIFPGDLEGGPITPKQLNIHDPFNSFYLRKKIGELHDTQIYWLCDEIADLHRDSVENYLGNTLYVFINRKLKEVKKKKKKSKMLQRRRNSLLW